MPDRAPSNVAAYEIVQAERELGKWIQKLRKARGLTQAEVSDSTSISESNISRIESGTRTKKLSQAEGKRLAKILELSPEDARKLRRKIQDIQVPNLFVNIERQDEETILLLESNASHLRIFSQNTLPPHVRTEACMRACYAEMGSHPPTTLTEHTLSEDEHLELQMQRQSFVVNTEKSIDIVISGTSLMALPLNEFETRRQLSRLEEFSRRENASLQVIPLWAKPSSIRQPCDYQLIDKRQVLLSNGVDTHSRTDSAVSNFLAMFDTARSESVEFPKYQERADQLTTVDLTGYSYINPS
jgi:transcriptional regulator with XRE-family HTH domain